MQPLLSPHLVLPDTARRPADATAAGDELDHRRPHLVWANGETLATAVPTLGTALIQHGLKEWLGSDGATRLSDTRVVATGRRAALSATVQALGPVMDSCEAENAMPMVICSDVELAAQWASQRMAGEHCLLMAVGAPYSGPADHAAANSHDMSFPLPLLNKPEAAATVWLGAPGQRSTLQVPVADGLRVDARHTTARSMQGHLAQAQARVCAVAPATLVCVLFIDDLCLHAGSAQGLPAEVFAATLRWLQAQAPWAVVFIVSHERVTTTGRHRVAELARHLGGALLKHRGLKRGGWGEPISSQACSLSPAP